MRNLRAANNLPDDVPTLYTKYGRNQNECTSNKFLAELARNFNEQENPRSWKFEKLKNFMEKANFFGYLAATAACSLTCSQIARHREASATYVS